jgi:hypothetical protein
VDGCEITINAHSYTIITAHKKGLAWTFSETCYPVLIQ